MKTRLPRPKHPRAIPKKRPSLSPHGSEPEVSSERLTAELRMLQTVSGLDQGENSKVELPESFSSPSCGERPSGCLPRPKGDLHKGDTSSDQGQIGLKFLFALLLNVVPVSAYLPIALNS